MNVKRFITFFLSAMMLLLSGIPVAAYDDEYYLSHEYNLTHTPVIVEAKNEVGNSGYGSWIFLLTGVEQSPNPDVNIRLYRSVNGGAFEERTKQQVNLTDGTNDIYEYSDHHVKNGNLYCYKIACTYKGKDITLSKPIIIYHLGSIRSDDDSIKNSSTGKTMTITWTRNSKADGYQIQYSTKQDWSNKITRKITNNKTTSLKLKNRTPGKQYQVRIRSYKKYKGTTYYSGWINLGTRYSGGW